MRYIKRISIFFLRIVFFIISKVKVALRLQNVVIKKCFNSYFEFIGHDLKF